jgi:dTDP-4-amino-4,6-dideoxygalactose transaminase
VSYLTDLPKTKHNYSYFPLFINEPCYGMSRDALYEKLKENNIYGRRYFYPLISQFSTYRGLESAQEGKMPVAEKAAREIICLPIHPDLDMDSVEEICDIISRAGRE